MHEYQIAATYQLLDVANSVVPPSEPPEQPMEIEEGIGGVSSSFFHQPLRFFQFPHERTTGHWEDHGDMGTGVRSMHLSAVGQTSDDEDAMMVDNLLTTDASSQRRASSSSVSSSPLPVGPTAKLLGLNKLIPSITPPRRPFLQLPAMPGAPRASRTFAHSESPQSFGSRDQSFSPSPSLENRRMSLNFSENDVLSKQNRDLALKVPDSSSLERALREENGRFVSNAHKMCSSRWDATVAQRNERIARQSAEQVLAPWAEVDAMDLDIPR